MQSDEFQAELDKQRSSVAEEQKNQQQLEAHAKNAQAIVDTIAEATKALMAFQSKHQPKVSVTNQKLPKSIKTPDIQKVVDALENLKQPLQDNKPDNTEIVKALGHLNDSIAKLPTSFPDTPLPVEEVTVKNQPDYTKQFDSLGNAIKSIDVKPVVNIPAEQPEDYSPILDSLTNVIDAINDIKIPQVPKTDLSPLIQATTAVQESITSLKFPVANYILPFKDINGKATQVQLDASGNIPTSGGSGGGDASAANQEAQIVQIANVTNGESLSILDEDKQDVLAYAQVLTANDSITPASGKRLQIVKSQILPDPVNATYNLVTLSFASIGNFFTCWAGSDSSVWIGAVNEALTITVSSTDNVSVNIRYKEI